MSKNKKEGSLDVPIFRYANEEFQVDFSIKRNEIGASELGYGQKKIVIKKIYEIEEPSTMRMLAGKIGHSVVEYKPIRTKIVRHINTLLDIKGEPLSVVKKVDYDEVLPGKKIRMHPDILTPYYPIEIKFTAMPTNKWTREVAPYYRIQLNTYSGYYKRSIGILTIINLNIFLTASKNWDYIMNNLTFTLPFEHNQKQYLKTRELAKMLFDCIDKEEYDHLQCPIHSWECSRCVSEVREYCGKDVYSCQFYDEVKEKKHNKKMYEYPKELTGKFTDKPLCEECFLKGNPHSKYEKYKFVNYKPKKKFYNGGEIGNMMLDDHLTGGHS